jgi:capsule polysaccharide modification protein KpsS
VVTFNSLSGFEALQRDRPVVMLGPLFYRLKNLVYWPERQTDLPETMWRAIRSTVDGSRLEGLLAYLRCKYEVTANRKRLTSRSLYNIASKILA